MNVAPTDVISLSSQQAKDTHWRFRIERVHIYPRLRYQTDRNIWKVVCICYLTITSTVINNNSYYNFTIYILPSFFKFLFISLVSLRSFAHSILLSFGKYFYASPSFLDFSSHRPFASAIFFLYTTLFSTTSPLISHF